MIIGILIASLMPRLSSAQDRARDVARKNDLSQLGTAIIAYQTDRGAYPSTGNYTDRPIIISEIAEDLQTVAGMTSVPADPLGTNVVLWLGGVAWTTEQDVVDVDGNGQYVYITAKKNSITNGGIVLMARTQTEWGSNWIVKIDEDGELIGNSLQEWVITSKDEITKIALCKSFVKDEATDNFNIWSDGICTYRDASQLRYVYIY